jgi:signal transduction histidine kinase
MVFSWRLRSPGALMAAALAVCAALVVGTTWLAVDQPWLGIELAPEADQVKVVAVDPDGFATHLAPGERLVSLGGLPVVAEDIIEDPDTFDTYADRDVFLQRQGAFRRALNASAVALEAVNDAGTRSESAASPLPLRPLSSLPLVFWVQIFSGAAGFLIAAWVWSLKPRDAAARLLALSGLGLLLSAYAAAVYSTRELALDPALFQPLTVFNHVGALLFGAAMVGLFLCYPNRLASRRALVGAFIALCALLLLDLLHGVLTPVGALYGPIALDMTLILGLIAWQWRASRGDPRARAALRWLGLSVALGAGAFTLSIAAPLLLGFGTAISQGYAFLFFVVIYVGLALGLRRYRLFELNAWAFRIFFFMGATLAFLALDATLIWILNFGERSALGLALAAVIFLYLPTREWMWRRTVGRREVSERDLVDGVTAAALAASTGERAELWEGLMRRLFDPLEIERVETDLARPDVALEGLELILPPTSDSPALKLRYPWGGRALFSPAHLALARQAFTLLGRLETGRDAFVQGAMAERRRIARDLHDDVGARLLTGLHEAGPETRPLLRAALADVRAIVGGLTGERRPLPRVLADLRYETKRRLEAAGIALDWPVADEDEAAEVLLDYDQYKNLSSAFREVISNLIRHAAADRAEVSVEHDGVLTIEVADDGVGLGAPAEQARVGHGLRNIAERIEAIGGALAFPDCDKGTRVRMTMPLVTPPVLGMPATADPP